MLDLKPEMKIANVNGSAFIHPQATVDYDSVRIGARTKVWQFASVIRNASIGADCNIASCAIVDGSTLWDNVIVSHGAFIDPGIVICNSVFIGPHVSLCNDYWPRVSKEGWFNMASLVAGEYIVTMIEDGASVGANAVVLPGIHIGKGAMVAAGAKVTKNVPHYHLYKNDGTIEPIKREPERKRYVEAR